jgi:citronellol/citronellal dehydrogenase
MNKLKGKVAIVTGASRGLGKAIAINFAREGADILVSSLGTDEGNPKLQGTIEETVAEVKKLGRRAVGVACNVADEESVIHLVEQTLQAFGTIDILANNAGVAFWQPTVELTAKRFDLVMAVGVRGTFLCSKYVLPTMIKNQSGSIINTTSIAADRRHDARGSVYGMSKAAIERFTYGLAAEVSKYNIAVNAYKPRGSVSTPGTRFFRTNQADIDAMDNTEMVEKATLFLAQQDAQHGVSGTVSTDEQLCIWHNL